MSALHVTYRLEDRPGSPALTIHLTPGDDGHPPHQRLRELHRAAEQWCRGEHFVASDLATDPPPATLRKEIGDYIYAGGEVNGGRLQRHLDQLLDLGRLHTFAPRPGAPAEGPDLIAREREVDALSQRLAKGGSVHLRAPRRYGKTSLLLAVTRELEKHRPALLIDVSSRPSVPSFLVTVARAALDRSALREPIIELPHLTDWPPPGADPLAKSQAASRLHRSLSEDRWRFGRQLFHTLGQAGSVLLVDEFSIFLRRALADDREEALRLLDLLLEFRRASKPLCQGFAGSSGLTAYLRFHALTEVLGDLVPVDLDPLNPEPARVLAEELMYAEDRVPSPETLDAILETIGEPIPYWIHALVGALCEEAVGIPSPPPALVRKAYESRILGTRGSGHFKAYRVSEQAYPPALAPHAASLLTEIARSPEGRAESELEALFLDRVPEEHRQDLPAVLACLAEDYDLVAANARWRMRSKVLRDRWLQAEPWLTSGGG